MALQFDPPAGLIGLVYRELAFAIEPSLRAEILEWMRQLIVSLNDLMKINPERKERIESHYVKFIVFCLQELNVWFMLARIGVKL